MELYQLSSQLDKIMSESTNDQDDSPLLFGCIKIGQSYNVKLLFPFTQTNDDNSLISLHYKFKPQGINPNIPGKILLKEAGDVDILLANQDNKEERFHGVCNESNALNEFILSFIPPPTTSSCSKNNNETISVNDDNDTNQLIHDTTPFQPMFTLQQVDTCVRQLRHVRDEEKFNEKATTHTSNTIKKMQTEQLNKLTSTTTNTTTSTKKRSSHTSSSGHNSVEGPKSKKKRCIEAVKHMLITRLKWP